MKIWAPAFAGAPATSGSLADCGLAFDDPEEVALLQDQEILTLEPDFGARPLAEQDAVAGLHVELDKLAGFVACARTDGDDLAFLRLFLGRVGNDDPAGGLLFGLDTADEDAVMKRSETHGSE